MAQRVLVAHGSTNGSMEKIAETVTDLDRYEAVVVGGVWKRRTTSSHRPRHRRAEGRAGRTTV
ncbi:hypothetical protein QNO09_27355 [Streptomyces sp. 378]|uniref:hypothetical protein n=1 Tax=Streptomyces sp. 378 TaxID=3049412 RepID=UPI0024C27A9B|nr:hypothetical protein [Streptomyces sp. 378]MDK1346958.1 hypothetical protein [Streptomyces sp. 378]